MTPNDITAALLAESAWLQRLARSLVRDPGLADDLAQETLALALQRPPREASAPRGWLATVLRRLLGHTRLERARRDRREHGVARSEPTAPLDTDERIRRHEALVQHVQALGEPYRTALVLRFFDDLPPREIAARTGAPVATVHSQLQRGLRQLRERLDNEPGGREEWLGALACIGWPRGPEAATAGGAAAAAVGGAAWPAAVLAAGAAVAAAVTLGLWWMNPSSRRSPAGSEAPTARSATAVARSPRDTSTDTLPLSDQGQALRSARGPVPDGGAAALGRVAEAQASPVAEPDPLAAGPAARLGLVVDLRGRLLAGVPVVRPGSVWPRWQGGDLGWINDGEQGAFLPPADVEALRADPGAAAAFFARFRHPDDWRAVVFAEPHTGARTATSDEDGRVDLGRGGANAALELATMDWVLVATAEAGDSADTTDSGDPFEPNVLLVVTPAVQVAGRVLDGAARPIVGAEVELVWRREATVLPLQLAGSALRDLPAPPATRTDAEGRFVLRAVPLGLAGCEVRASAKGHAPLAVPAPTTARGDLDLVLPSGAPGALSLAGLVLDPAGAPVAGAEVRLDRDTTTTDASGRFRFTGVEPRPTAVLTALAPGYAPAQRMGLVPALRARASGDELVVLAFTERTRTLRGVVLGEGGGPLAGVLVNVCDPTLLDVTFTPLEGRLGGWERGAAADEGGRFELGGLAGRAYRLRVWRPGTSFVFVTEPIAATEQDVVVLVPNGAFHAEVRGRVVSEGGARSGSVLAALTYPIHVTRSGAGSMTEGPPPVPIAPDGTFVLRDVPRRDAELTLAGDDGRAVMVPVEAIAADGTVTVSFDGSRLLRVVGAREGEAFEVVDAEDNVLEVTAFEAGVARRVRRFVAGDAGPPPCAVPAEAEAVWVRSGTGTDRRVTLAADGAGLVRAAVAP